MTIATFDARRLASWHATLKRQSGSRLFTPRSVTRLSRRQAHGRTRGDRVRASGRRCPILFLTDRRETHAETLSIILYLATCTCTCCLGIQS